MRRHQDALDGNKAALLPSTARTLPPAPDDSALGGLWLQAEASGPTSRLPEKAKPPRPGEQPTPASKGGAWQLGGPTHHHPPRSVHLTCVTVPYSSPGDGGTLSPFS